MPNDPKNPYTQNVPQPVVPSADNTPKQPPTYSREEMLAMDDAAFKQYAEQARAWKAHTEAEHATALAQEAEAIKAQVAAENAAKELKLKNLRFNGMTGAGILAGTAGLLGGLYGGKKLWDHYHPRPQLQPVPMPPVPEAQDTETHAMPEDETPKQANIDSLVEPAPLLPPSIPPNMAQYDLDFMPDIQARNALVQQLLKNKSAAILDHAPLTDAERADRFQHPVEHFILPPGGDITSVYPEAEYAKDYEAMMRHTKQANWFGDVGRRIAGRSPEYIQQRNIINALGKAKAEQDALTALAQRHGVPHGHPGLPEGVSGAAAEPEQSFLQRNKWPLIGAGGLGAGYLAYQNGAFGGLQGDMGMKMGYDEEKLAGMFSSIANKVKGAVKGKPKPIPFAKPMPKEPPKPQPMAEKATDKKPVSKYELNKGKTTKEVMDSASERNKARGGVPFAKVVPKTAAEQGYEDMLIRLGLIKSAAPAIPQKAMAASFKKGPPPIPPKARAKVEAEPSPEFKHVQRTMGFGQNSPKVIKKAAFEAGYVDALAALGLQKMAAKVPLLTSKAPAKLVGSSMPAYSKVPLSVTPPNAASAESFTRGFKSTTAPGFGQGIVPSKPPVPKPSPGADTQAALRKLEGMTQKAPTPTAAPAKIDPSKAPPLRQGGRQGMLTEAPKPKTAPSTTTPVKAPPPANPKAPEAPKPQKQETAGAPPKAAPPAGASAAPPTTPAAAEVPAQPGAFRQGLGKMREGFNTMPAGARYGILGGGAGLAGLGLGGALGAAMQPDVNVIH